MKHSGKKVFLLFFISIFLLTGCMNASEDEANIMNETSITESTPMADDSNNYEESATSKSNEKVTSDSDANKVTEDTIDQGSSSEENSESLDVMTPPDNREIGIYTIDEETLETKSTVVLVPSDYEITPKMIVELVVEDIADKSYEVIVNNVYAENEYIVVDLSSKNPFLQGLGSTVEATILDAIAFSLVDNFDEYQGVIFRLDDGPYSSEHFQFEFSEVYLTKGF